MQSFKLRVNGKTHTVDAEPDMPLLWALRDLLGLTGTKYGCGVAQCRACTVLVDGVENFSCQMKVSSAIGADITTIEGLATGDDGSVLSVVQNVWVRDDIPQCGYCQPGQILTATALLKRNRKPTDEDIDAAMAGNICRCGTYNRIRRGVHTAARELGDKK